MRLLNLKRIEREVVIEEKEDKKLLAMERTKEAERAINEVENILKHTLKINDAIEWNALLDKSVYPKRKPKPMKLLEIPIEPKETDREFASKINFFIEFFSDLKQERIDIAKDLFKKAHFNWEKEKINTEEKNRKMLKDYEENLLEWQKEGKKYIEKREEKNKHILELKEKYSRKEPLAIIEYCNLVLSNSEYPDTFPQEFEIEYVPETKILLVDYLLPNKENIPTLKEVKYIASQDQFKEKHISELEINKLYDDILYQITLRSIHELFEADAIDSISSVVFNGNVRFIDKGTGKEVVACILSIQAQKDEFMNINLENVDAKACFKILKGIGSSKLHGLAPIAPIMKLNKEDKRFVTPYAVAESMDEKTNIAAMDWKDFENLIRELFKKNLRLRVER